MKDWVHHVSETARVFIKHSNRTPVKINFLTFLCSLAFLGLSGVCDPFAGAPAIGDAVCFSIVSAGIVETKKKVFKSKSSMDALVKK